MGGKEDARNLDSATLRAMYRRGEASLRSDSPEMPPITRGGRVDSSAPGHTDKKVSQAIIAELEARLRSSHASTEAATREVKRLRTELGQTKANLAAREKAEERRRTDPHIVLYLDPETIQSLNPAQRQVLYNGLRKLLPRVHHPDVGGKPGIMGKINGVLDSFTKPRRK